MAANDDVLFSSRELGGLLAEKVAGLEREVAAAAEEYLLNTDIDEWAAYLVEVYSIESPVLRIDEMEFIDEGETPVDVSHDHFHRAIADPTSPAYVTGRRLVLHMPFDGDPELFFLRPNTFTHNPPRGAVTGSEITRAFEYSTDTAPPDLKTEAERGRSVITQWLGWSQAQVEQHNESLDGLARQSITARRQRVIADRAHLDDLGIPVRRRDDAPTTYAAPGITRRKPPARPTATAAPAHIEPTMIGPLYEHILGLIRSWSRALERTPGRYADHDEESLRDALLPMLNSHYEGQATGETFNASGKTDILIRVDDRNVFIGECKWWGGPAAANDALQQLFSYTTWRDTKIALIFFVRNKDLTSAIEKARELLQTRDEFVDWQASEEGELRCEMTWPGDENIRAQLAVLFAHLPAG